MQVLLLEPDPDRASQIATAVSAAVPGCEVVIFESARAFDSGRIRGAGLFVWLDAGCEACSPSCLVAETIRELDPCPVMCAAVSRRTPTGLIEALYQLGADVACFDPLLSSIGDAVRAFSVVRTHRLRAAYRAACAQRIALASSEDVARAAGYAVAPPDVRPLDQIIREHARTALRVASGNRRAAARLLGISRGRLYRLVE